MRGIGFIVGLVMITSGAVALADPLPDGGITPEEMSGLLQKQKLPSEMSKAKDGSPIINSRSDGIEWSVYFYECQKSGRCQSIQFAAGFQKKLPAAVILEWNRAKRFGRSYLNTDGGPWVEMDVDLEHGATTEAVDNDIERWRLTVREFNKVVTSGAIK